MRESIGGSWIFGIVALFVVLFSSFIAYSVAYTKAFKVKNEIINIIEKSEGFTLYDLNAGNPGATGSGVRELRDKNDCESRFDNHVCPAEALSYLLIDNVGYNKQNVNKPEYGNCYEGGYCILKVCTDTKVGAKIYYKVTTFIKIKIPVVNLALELPVKGETKELYYDISGLACMAN